MKNNDELRKIFSERLKEVLKHYYLTGRGFADKLGLTYSTVNNYINGTKVPSAEFLVTMLSKLPEISADWLLLGKGDMLNKVNLDVEKLKEEVHDLKMTVLVKEGIIRELRDNILEKMK